MFKWYLFNLDFYRFLMTSCIINHPHFVVHIMKSKQNTLNTFQQLVPKHKIYLFPEPVIRDGNRQQIHRFYSINHWI